MIKYCIVNGAPRAGKSTFADYVVSILEKRGDTAAQLSSVDIVKQISKELGWNGEKTPAVRKFLSDFKALLVSSPWGNLTMKYIVDYANRLDCAGTSKYKDTYILVMVREPEEIQEYVNKYGAIAVLVLNDKVDNLPVSNLSDAMVNNYSYHYYIKNNGTLDDLYAKAEDFVNFWTRRTINEEED